MRKYLRSLIALLLSMNTALLWAQDTLNNGFGGKCAYQFCYSPDRSRFYHVGIDCDSLLIADFHTATYYDHLRVYEILPQAERDYMAYLHLHEIYKPDKFQYEDYRVFSGNPNVLQNFTREELGYISHDYNNNIGYLLRNRRQDSVIRRVLAMGFHTYVLSISDFKIVIQSNADDLQTGVLKKYYRGKLVAEGYVVHGGPLGYFKCYKYELNSRYQLLYFKDLNSSAGVLDEGGLSIRKIVLGASVGLMLFVLTCIWIYQRRKRGLPFYLPVYLMLLLVNVSLSVADNTDQSHPSGLNTLLQAVYVPRVFRSFFWATLLIISVVNIFKKGVNKTVKWLSIAFVIVNLLIALWYIISENVHKIGG